MKTNLLIVFIFLTSFSYCQTQGEMNQEACDAHELADKTMAKIYFRLMDSRSSETEKNLLLTDQRAWIKYKEAHCKSIAYQFEGGSMQTMISCSCLENLTNDRIRQLNEYDE
jgi:uncharacterized protein YecT (DUF1311 family)